jgi:hypothetical protein
LGDLVGPSASVVQEQKRRVVPTALGSALVGCFQQRIQLILFQVPNQRARGLLRRDGPNLTGPFQVFRAAQTNESRERTDCRETLITRGDLALASLLQILEEGSGPSRGNVLDPKPLDLPVGGASDERQELP